MRYSGLQIVFQEIPNEISLAIHFTGCPLKCKGCHSNDLWSPASGYDLDALKFEFTNPIELLKNDIKKTTLLSSSKYSKVISKV